MRTIILLSTLVLGATIGCGDDNRASNIEDADGGADGLGGSTGTAGGESGGDAGSDTGGSTAAGGDGGAAGSTTTPNLVNQEGAPTITFLSPAAVTDPNVAGVIIDDTVDVVCQATAATEPAGSTVNAGSTTLTMTQGTEIVSDGPLTNVLANGILTSTFDLSQAVSGALTFTCQADDASTPAKTGQGTLNVLVDRGPDIAVSEPDTTTIVSRTVGADVRFTVTPTPLSDADENAGIVEVIASLNGTAVNLTTPTSLEGEFAGHVDLTSSSVFPESDDAYQVSTLRVVARNERGAIREAYQTFKIDGNAPNIAITDPAASTIVGNSVTIAFTVEDGGAGVDTSSVAVALGSQHKFYYDAEQTARWSLSGSTYTFTFDAAEILGTSSASVIVQVSATDLVGNANSDGASISLDLDQQPPYINLDPPPVRENYFRDASFGYECSTAFDPLGEAVNDRAIVDKLEVFRALVWDQANYVEAGATRYYALTNPAKVWLYLRSAVAADIEMFTDSADSDTQCDDLLEGDNLPPIQLKPLAPLGIAPWVTTADANDDTRYYSTADEGYPTYYSALCGNADWAKTDEEFLCNRTSDMVRVINHEVSAETPEPVVYALDPNASPSPDCTGRALDLGGLLGAADGWYCVAVKAIDNVGNRSVSAPIRICYDNPDTTAVPVCAQDQYKEAETAYNSAMWSTFIPNNGLSNRSTAPGMPTCHVNALCALPGIPEHEMGPTLENQQ